MTTRHEAKWISEGLTAELKSALLMTFLGLTVYWFHFQFCIFLYCKELENISCSFPVCVWCYSTLKPMFASKYYKTTALPTILPYLGLKSTHVVSIVNVCIMGRDRLSEKPESVAGFDVQINCTWPYECLSQSVPRFRDSIYSGFLVYWQLWKSEDKGTCVFFSFFLPFDLLFFSYSLAFPSGPALFRRFHLPTRSPSHTDMFIGSLHSHSASQPPSVSQLASHVRLWWFAWAVTLIKIMAYISHEGGRSCVCVYVWVCVNVYMTNCCDCQGHCTFAMILISSKTT